MMGSESFNHVYLAAREIQESTAVRFSPALISFQRPHSGEGQGKNALARSWCAEHVRQLGSVSPVHNLMG